MAGKFEIETSSAGIFSRDGSVTGMPVNGLMPGGKAVAAEAAPVGVSAGVLTRGVDGEADVWQPTRNSKAKADMPKRARILDDLIIPYEVKPILIWLQPRTSKPNIEYHAHRRATS